MKLRPYKAPVIPTIDLAPYAKANEVASEITQLNTKFAQLSNLEAKPGVVVPQNDPTWFGGAWWINKSGASYTLPETITEAVLTAARFERSVALLNAGAATDIVAGSNTNALLWAAKELSDGIKGIVDARAIPRVQFLEDNGIQWNANFAFSKGRVVMRGRTFFEALRENKGIDPETDNTGAWAVFNPGATDDLFESRSPNKNDIYKAGTKWWDQSYGVTTPLGFVSTGNGAWVPITQITLTRIRFNVAGRNTSYRSTLGNIRIYREDNTVIPNGWWIWGNQTINGGTKGTAYSGGHINTSYASGYFEFDTSANFDANTKLGKIVGDYHPDGAYTSVKSVEFYYSNGSKKVYTGTDWQQGPDKTACLIEPALECKVGDAIAAAQGLVLTTAQLTDPSGTDAGRVTGEAFVAAWHALYQSEPDKETASFEEALAQKTSKAELEEKTAELKASIANADTLLGNRISAAEQAQAELASTVDDAIAANTGLYVVSDDPPDDSPNWKLWVQNVKDVVTWKGRHCLIVRISPTLSVEMVCSQWVDLPAPVHDNAVQTSPGEFTLTIPGGGQFSYSTSRAQTIDQFSFEKNVYNGVGWWYLDGAGNTINGTVRAETIGSENTAHGCGRAAPPANAASVRYRFVRVDNTFFEFLYPLV